MVRPLTQARRLAPAFLALVILSGSAGPAFADDDDAQPKKKHTRQLAQDDSDSPKTGDSATPPKKKKKKHKDGEDKADKSKDKDKDSDEAKAAPASDSTANRKNKHITVAAETGLIDLLHAGYGVNVGYFMTPNNMLELNYLQTDFELLGFQSKINVASLRIKHFLTNSFYMQAGAGIRQLESVDNNSVFSSLVAETPYSSTFDSTYAVAEIGLGNRWQFSNFTIGCDWIGYVQPLAQLSSSEAHTGPITDDQLASDRQSFQSSSKNGNVLLLNFNVGFSF